MQTPDGTPIRLITSEPQLDELLARWQQPAVVALDTEFIRTDTFYAKIGLLQLADHDTCYLVDPLAVSDWRSLREFLASPDTTAVMHSCSEDLNLLHTAMDCMPVRIFDTQLAAAFLGFGFSISYQGLVRELLGEDISKDETRSDWLQRPLSQTQLTYAASDVSHLPAAQEQLLSRLRERRRLEWFEEDCQFLQVAALAIENPETWENYYASISNAWRLSEAELGHLQQLCYWRERKSRQRNRPRNWIARDADLLTIAVTFAANGADTISVLKRDSDLSRKFLSFNGDELIKLLTRPHPGLAPIDRNLLDAPLSQGQRKTLKAMRSVVQEIARELGMAPEILARKRHLQDLLRSFQVEGQLAWTGDLAGWRRQLLEPEFNQLLSA